MCNKEVAMYVLALAAVALTLFAIGCDSRRGKNYELDARSFAPENLRMIEKQTGIAIPDGSRGLNLLYEGRQIDPAFAAKVEIPAASHEEVAEMIRRFRNSDTHVHNPISERVAWWNVRKNVIREERAFSTDTNLVHVLLCEEGGRWFLYLEWYSR
jgi:hypothetical protein